MCLLKLFTPLGSFIILQYWIKFDLMRLSWHCVLYVFKFNLLRSVFFCFCCSLSKKATLNQLWFSKHENLWLVEYFFRYFNLIGQTSVHSELSGYPLWPWRSVNFFCHLDYTNPIYIQSSFWNRMIQKLERGKFGVQELKRKYILLQKMEYLGLMSQDSPISYFVWI